MPLYLDLVMVLNFLVDFLLLLGTGRLTGYPAEGKKCAAAALLGSVYSGVCLLPGFRFLGSLLWRSIFLGLMGVLAFGLRRSTLKQMGVFLLLSMALGGAAVSIGRSGWLPLALASAGIWLTCRMVFPEGVGNQSYIPLKLTHGDTCLTLTALRDTGNTLRDPVTGEQVLVLSAEAAEILTGLTREQLRQPLETMAQRPVPGLRLIPYRAVGSSGFLLGLRFPDAEVGTQKKSIVAAFAPEGLGGGTGCQALAGGMV